ncbi:MAG: hypothetical protein N2749_07310 [Clostridia bacterium]|nr:hypothetical protein [Clostridia bacterium]
MVKNNNLIYVWLSILKDIDYTILLKLLFSFKTVNNIYESSKKTSFFKNVLFCNKIQMSEKLFYSLIDNSLKVKAQEIYSKLIEYDIKIIPFDSKNYPKPLLNLYSPPIVIYMMGNYSLGLNISSKTVVCMSGGYYNSASLSYINDYLQYFKLKDVLMISTNNNDIENMVDRNIKEKLIVIEYMDICNLNYNFYIFISRKYDLNKNNIIFIYTNLEKHSNYEKNKIIVIMKNEICSGLADLLVMINMKYSFENMNKIDMFIEQGKDVMVLKNKSLKTIY